MTELDKWKKVAEKLNIALIHSISWVYCNECENEGERCEACVYQLKVTEDAIKAYYEVHHATQETINSCPQWKDHAAEAKREREKI